MSYIDVEGRVRLSDILAVIAKHYPATVLPAEWKDDPGMVMIDSVRVRVDDALGEISQSDIDEAASYADDDGTPEGQVDDREALAEFVAAAIAGDLSVARILAGRTFAGGDVDAVDRVFDQAAWKSGPRAAVAA